LKKSRYILFFLLLGSVTLAQINTFSPYSRFGLGELNQTTFAHNQSMGGTCIALKPDSIFPSMINTGNPASYCLIKFATFEVGGNFAYSNFSTKNSMVYKWNTNFNYGSLGFPIRQRGGLAFGLMPYTNVGYNIRNVVSEPNIGDVSYSYNGEGGFNKVFLGYGVMPFKERLTKFKRKHLKKGQDSAYHISTRSYKFKEFWSEIASDFSIGANANYLFGSTLNYADVRYPNSLTYLNTIREKTIRINDFTGNFGIQTAFTIDSARYRVKDTSNKTIRRGKRIMSEKVKFVFGYYMGLNNTLKAKYDLVSYNYFLAANGATIIKDTVIRSLDQNGKITLPLEQGFGIGIKKGERLNLVMDYAITNWSNFKMFGETSTLKNNMRASLGINYVPEKFATGKGTYFRRAQYRAGLFYNSGFLNINKTQVSTYGVSAGVSLPVGIRSGSGLVNIGVQYGRTGTQVNNLIREDFVRINFGFTFNATHEDYWFKKFRYD
jgi:hypothetical protein